MYRIIFKSPAEKFLRKLDNSIQQRVIGKLKKLKENPRLGKPLTATLAGLWSLRIDKYRAIYKVIENKLIIMVLDISHRKDIYGRI